MALQTTSRTEGSPAANWKLHRGSGTLNRMSFAPGPRKATNALQSAPDRIEPAWRVWLEALASDAEAALGAALAYQVLDPDARAAVLDVLEHDATHLDIPRVAIFAPILSVEHDEQRRERIRKAMGDDVGVEANVPARALMGVADDGDQIIVAETHAYLDFVRVTVCRLDPDHCVRWVRNESLIHAKDAARSGAAIEGTKLDVVPLNRAVDAIARAIVAQRRRDGHLPDSLRLLIELFDAHACEVEKTGR